MKALIISLALLGALQLTTAQDTVFIGQNYKWLDNKNGALEYAVIKKMNDGRKQVSFYTLDNRLKGVGEYSVYEADRRTRDGRGTYLYTNGRDSMITHHRNGVSDGEFTLYYKDGILKRREIIKEGKFVSGECFNPAGEEIEFFEYVKRAQFPGGFEALNKYVREHTNYPVNINHSMNEGRVKTAFTITKEGKMDNIRIEKGSSEKLNKEALRVLKKVARKFKWEPAQIDGKVSDFECTYTVRFTLD